MRRRDGRQHRRAHHQAAADQRRPPPVGIDEHPGGHVAQDAAQELRRDHLGSQTGENTNEAASNGMVGATKLRPKLMSTDGR